MSDLPVRELILYKHGVGFFRREGKITEEEVELTFREDEINDVLKSLAIFDREGGQVLGVHYQTPMDKYARLADSSIRLDSGSSMIDLLKDLRGREVELELPNEILRGRLIGVDTEDADRIDRTLISIATVNDQVRVLPMKLLLGVKILDRQANQDLQYFLDTSVREDIRRVVTVQLSPGKHKLVVYYVAPSPTWRVSYRLIAEAENGEDHGTALLQGWGLFDNRLDEDLKKVKVTLVAGQPISFIYDLYASRIPARPTVQDEARVAPGPVEFQAPRPQGRALAKRMGAAPMEEAAADFMMAGAAMPAAAEMMSMDAMASSVSVSAQGEESGEFFRYEVTTPVSVKRGESALVPILGENLSYSKEYLYNGAKLPGHPVAALRFDNTTGLTLERGPVTVIEDGDYRGEAVVPFTRTDNDVYLAYAVELGVQVTERAEHRVEMAGLDLQARFLVVNEYQVQATHYTLENTTDRDLAITVESFMQDGYELFDTPQPDVETSKERRWRVDVPAHSTVEFQRSERHLTHRHEEVRNLNYRRLQRFLSERWIDSDTFDMLSGILDNLGFINNARTEQAEMQQERATIFERQSQLRKNITTLKPAGEEGPLRSRMLHQLEATEDRLEAIDARIAELDAQITDAEAQIEQSLRLLGGENQ